VQEGPFKRFCRKAGYLERLLFVIANHSNPTQDIVKNFDQDIAKIYREKLGYRIEIKEKDDVWLYTPCHENGIKLGWWDDQKNDWREVKNNKNGRLDLLEEIFDSEILKKQDKEDHGPSKLIYSSMREGEKKENFEKFEFPPFVFIVDEINRANLSAVLGELMFCLEYRGVDGSVPLTYDALSMDNANRDAYAPINLNTQDINDRFFVPSNLYFIGTMNTIDKSTESIDFALRRRFGWWYLSGEERINPAVFYDNGPSEFGKIANETHEKLNINLAKHLSRQSEDLRIGPTYFYKLKDIHKVLKNRDYSLKWLYHHYLRPTLEDYFQGNTSKWKNAENDFLGLFTTDETTDLDERITVHDLKNALNIIPQVIIYGSPGTGKTYLARQYKKEFSVPDNQWEFIQFHPAYTYEDFLQGIRPIPNDKGADYKLTPGKFKSFCMRAGALERALFAGLVSERTEAQFDSYQLSGNKIKYYGITIVEWQERKTGYVFIVGGATRLFHTKTQDPKTNIEAIKWILNTISEDIWIDNIIDDIIEEIEIVGSGLVEEQIADKIYLEGLRKKHYQYYTIVIDEINRGDLASIFGELMYCLEYRGPDGHIQLPYTIDEEKNDKSDYFASIQGREVFFIPSNVRIIGTMNTIDRSTEPIDYAMRRRFAWLRVGPDEQTLEKALKELSKKHLPQDAWKESHKEIICIVDMFRKFNEILKNIRSMPSEDFRIGETYFFRIIDLLREAFETCGDSEDEPIKSAFRKIKRGPIEYNKRVIDLLFEQYLEPVLEDYFTLAGKRWRKDRDGRDGFINIIGETECAKKQKNDNRTNGAEEVENDG
jgi:5-methylcytosine-specific restriction endonuclease McrBC GTP-binding regulatory subunit McrB